MPTKVSSVQSVDRAFSILEEMARNGGEIGLTELATELDLPVPTVHRAMQTLVNLGYAKEMERANTPWGHRFYF